MMVYELKTLLAAISISLLKGIDTISVDLLRQFSSYQTFFLISYIQFKKRSQGQILYHVNMH
jgi:hypothetical protein